MSLESSQRHKKVVQYQEGKQAQEQFQDGIGRILTVSKEEPSTYQRGKIFRLGSNWAIDNRSQSAKLLAVPRRIYPNLHYYFAANPRTMTRIADEMDISLPFLSAIRWGYREPNLPLALKLAQRCQVPLESLIMKRPER